MTNTKTYDIKSTIKQIKTLEKAGCELVRISIPDEKSASAIQKIKNNITIPLVGDIHFDYKLALQSIKNGIDKIRINPGNMNKNKISEIVKCAKDYGVSIRIGINSGSLKEFHNTKNINNVSGFLFLISGLPRVSALPPRRWRGVPPKARGFRILSLLLTADAKIHNPYAAKTSKAKNTGNIYLSPFFAPNIIITTKKKTNATSNHLILLFCLSSPSLLRQVLQPIHPNKTITKNCTIGVVLVNKVNR